MLLDLLHLLFSKFSKNGLVPTAFINPVISALGGVISLLDFLISKINYINDYMYSL